MASSRWKRFAFFERHSLNLPPDVLEDVLPLAETSAPGGNTSDNSASGAMPSGPHNISSDGSYTLRPRMEVTPAGLPPVSSWADLTNDNTNSNSKSSNPILDQDTEQAMQAMWSSLMACSSAPTSPTAANNAVASEMVAFPTSNAAPSRSNSLVSDNGKNNTSKQAVVDGLVLAFITSPSTELVHCVDLTIRCNPPTSNSASKAPGAPTGGGSANPNTGTAGNEILLEDLDGWRGYFRPFAPSPKATGPPSGNPAATNAIVDIAVCRVPVVTPGGGLSMRLHVVCASRTQLVVWQDPHWHLSGRRPITPALVSKVPPLPTFLCPRWILSPSEPTSAPFSVVAATPGGLVAVGTLDGTVLVYTYNPNNSANGTNVLRRYLKIPPPLVEGGPRIKVVRLFLFVPNQEKATKPTDGASWSQPKAHLFVAYHRPQSAGTSASTSTAAGAENANSSSTTSGLCCYEIPLPQKSSYGGAAGSGTTSAASSVGASGAGGPVLAAPSARHDLDGRFVGHGGLVDAAPNHGVGSTTSGSMTHHWLWSPPPRVTVARHDGVYTYGTTERLGVAPIDGQQLALAVVPPALQAAARGRTGVVGNAGGRTTNTASTPGGTTSTTANIDAVGTTAASQTPAGGTSTPLPPDFLPGYALVASTDEKSGRDAVDIYDATNKLVAFHLLLSPGHRAVGASGVGCPPTLCADGTLRGGRSSAVVLTSGGILVTLTEKLTEEKVDLLVQKNLYSAAIVVAFSDPSYAASEITLLYRRYAEHLYRKGDFAGAMDQYIHTIGALESSHVIFRFLDAPKIPLLVQYLEHLRQRQLATPVHCELLRTCYLKLNDTAAAEAIATTLSSKSLHKASLASILANLSHHPKEALASICALEAPEAAEILVIHGASLARVLPRETAGLVVSLTVGTYSPRALANVASAHNKGANTGTTDFLRQMVESAGASTASSNKAFLDSQVCEPYPVELFASAFLEQPKMLRLILAHCNRNKCPMSPSLRRTLLELTLAEWNQAKRTGDSETVKLRRNEAVAALTDPHARDIGDYEALVLVQLAGFEEGQVLLYERLQMTALLLERYAADGSEKSRRHMLAMCQADPEILADVLGHLVTMASRRLQPSSSKDDEVTGQQLNKPDPPSDSSNQGTTLSAMVVGNDSREEPIWDDETEEILEDIREALAMARRQGVLPPVRVARILAGEGTGQFSTSAGVEDNGGSSNSNGTGTHVPTTVPLSVALDYVGSILEESRQEVGRLKAEVEEYNRICNGMEDEIQSLLRTSRGLGPVPDDMYDLPTAKLSIDELYARVRSDDNDYAPPDRPLEAFWREMNQSEDTFDTIARFFAKGVIR